VEKGRETSLVGKPKGEYNESLVLENLTIYSMIFLYRIKRSISLVKSINLGLPGLMRVNKEV